MKYKVIGWTSLTDRRFKMVYSYSNKVDQAVIDDIKKNNYLFGGDFCDDYAPVLNTGEVIEYSARSFGALMGIAHRKNETDEICDYYMTEFIKHECQNFPSSSYIDDKDIEPISKRRDTYDFFMTKDEFLNIKLKNQKILLRLNDENIQKIEVEDLIEFSTFSSNYKPEPDTNIDFSDLFGYYDDDFYRSESYFCDDDTFEISLIVKDIIREKNFESLLLSKNNNTLKYRKEDIGCNDEISIFIDSLNKKYSKEDIKKYGVVALVVLQKQHYVRLNLEISSDNEFDQSFFEELKSYTNNFDLVGNKVIVNNTQVYLPKKVKDLVWYVLNDFEGFDDRFSLFIIKHKLNLKLNVLLDICPECVHSIPKYDGLYGADKEFLKKFNVDLNLVIK